MIKWLVKSELHFLVENNFIPYTMKKQYEPTHPKSAFQFGKINSGEAFLDSEVYIISAQGIYNPEYAFGVRTRKRMLQLQ